eukprot:765407-Hanusia_phi.AAC.9
MCYQLPGAVPPGRDHEKGAALSMCGFNYTPELDYGSPAANSSDRSDEERGVQTAEAPAHSLITHQSDPSVPRHLVKDRLVRKVRQMPSVTDAVTRRLRIPEALRLVGANVEIAARLHARLPVAAHVRADLQAVDGQSDCHWLHHVDEQQPEPQIREAMRAQARERLAHARPLSQHVEPSQQRPVPPAARDAPRPLPPHRPVVTEVAVDQPHVLGVGPGRAEAAGSSRCVEVEACSTPARQRCQPQLTRASPLARGATASPPCSPSQLARRLRGEARTVLVVGAGASTYADVGRALGAARTGQAMAVEGDSRRGVVGGRVRAGGALYL